MKLRTELLLLSISSTAVLTIAVAFLSQIISKFTVVLESLNSGVSDLPLFTKIILSTYTFWWVFPLATFSLGLYIFKNDSFSVVYQSALVRVFIGGFVLAILLLIFTQGSWLAATNFMSDGVNNP